MSPRAFGPERNVKLRVIVEEIRARDFSGNQEKTAEALGVKGPTLHNFLNGTRGAGMKLLDGIVRYTRKPIDQLMGTAPVSVDFRPFSDLSGWEGASVEAQKRYPHVPAAMFEAVGRWRGPEPPGTVTEVLVGELAEAVWKASLSKPVPMLKPEILLESDVRPTRRGRG